MLLSRCLAGLKPENEGTIAINIRQGPGGLFDAGQISRCAHGEFAEKQ
jgi:hypothetical protein